MKIVIPGGSGQVGRMLARAFAASGHDVVVLSRKPSEAQRRACYSRIVQWDAQHTGPWVDEIDGADVVINLAGRSVNCRYNTANRRAILESRVQSTRVVGDAIATAASPPGVWLQASTATIYGHHYDSPNDEISGVLGGDEAGASAAWRFSTDVAKAWEQAAVEADTPRTRKVLMRSALTLSADRGGILAVLLRLVRFGLGGRAGDGRQYVSWVHEVDFVRAVSWLIERDDLAGPINVAAPFPVPNAEFMHALRAAWGKRIGLPATRTLIELGAFLLRTESELVLKSRRVVPARLLASGFGFALPSWPEAAADLCAQYRGDVRNAALTSNVQERATT